MEGLHDALRREHLKNSPKGHTKSPRSWGDVGRKCHEKRSVYRKKSPVYTQKSPACHIKSPVDRKKRPIRDSKEPCMPLCMYNTLQKALYVTKRALDVMPKSPVCLYVMMITLYGVGWLRSVGSMIITLYGVVR